MAEYSGNPRLYYSRYPWNELGVRIFDPTAQDLWGTLGWNEDNWDNGGQPPTSSLKDWSQLTSSEESAARTLGFKESTWDAPSAPKGWAYIHPLEDYFRNFQWSSMLKYEKNLFACLGWDESLFNDPTKASDTWFSRWEDLTIEEQLCATAIGYHKVRWNSKPSIPTCISSASGTVSDGESCSANSNCQSGWCKSLYYGASTIGCQGTCKPKREIGHRCYGTENMGLSSSDPASCVSGICYCDMKCSPETLWPNGSKCEKNSDCESGWCCKSGMCDGYVTIGCQGTCTDECTKSCAVIREWIDSVEAVEMENASSDISTDCYDHSYEIGLYSFPNHGSHFFLAATNPMPTEKCPHALVLASLQGLKTKFIIPNKNHLMDEFDVYKFGNADLEELLIAEGSVEPVHDSDYDITQNNCAHYAQSIWRNLKFDETPELADYLIDNILRDDSVMEYIKEEATDYGGLRVLSKFTAGKRFYEKFVKESVISQLDLVMHETV
eukprot:scaffold11019_cov38-Cyclotella_meneghiniana.AAC.2